MKKLFSFFAAVLMSASLFSTPASVPTVADVASAGFDVTNARVIVLYFDEQVCNDIVWAGSYNEWNISPEDMLTFEQLEGFAGWYALELFDSSDPCEGRPVQLKKDGSFSWDFQTGEPDAWINMDQPGTQMASIEYGYSGESDITLFNLGVYIYEVEYFKFHNTPCGVEPTPITVNAVVPAGTPACYFYGEMSANTFVEMTKLDDTHYTIDFPDATSIGWGYRFVWENGNWATANSDPEGDFSVEPVNGVIDVEVRAWATAPVPAPISVDYIDENGEEQTASAYVVADASTQVTLGTVGETSWYVVNGADVQLTNGAVCNGDVHLILADGAKLTASGASHIAGIQVSGEDNLLTIYGQTAQTGQLIAKGGYDAAAIGGGSGFSGSNITINGGNITATGGESGAGIGGGSRGIGSNITINGGVVVAEGGDDAAGIGGGHEADGSNITINGGDVTAIGGDAAAGIGGGGGSGTGSNIIINGGKITATGGDIGSGIGGGSGSPGSNIIINDGVVEAIGGIKAAGIGGGSRGIGSNITINGGMVIATGGAGGASIGNGKDATLDASNINVTTNCIIKAGDSANPTDVITNTGADLASSLADKQYATIETKPTPISVDYIDENGEEQTASAYVVADASTQVILGTAGETSWYVVNGADVQLTNGAVCNGDVRLILADDAKLTATGADSKAGVHVSGEDNSLTIYGQTAQSGQLIATGGEWGAGIGGEDGNYDHSVANGSNITINGGMVEAIGGFKGAGIGAGYRGNGSYITINRGTVVATGGDYGAGIGGGYGNDDSSVGNGSDIIINGGMVTANGGEEAAGIGGGYDSNGSNITINGGTVVATGGDDASGIGGGTGANGSNIIINGGDVTAIGGDAAAGIGGGGNGSGSNITINGGSIKVNGGGSGAGIGGGTGMHGFDITINDGVVEAIGGIRAAGIGGGSIGTGSNITINGGTVVATGGYGGASIGNGMEASLDASNIKVTTNCIIKAGNSANPTDEITNTGADLASSLADKQYATIETKPTPISVDYIDENGEEQTASAYVVADASTQVTLGTVGETSWYVVNGADVHLTKGAVCNGDVRLILADDAKLTATGWYDEEEYDGYAGIQVSGEGNSLSVYGQAAQTGQLIAQGSKDCAGIGSEKGVCVYNITINGGNITATGGGSGAGIGSGHKTHCYNITINGGTVEANGGNGAAGIGGGDGGNVSNIVINGGTVTANGGTGCAGIGAGNKGVASDIYVSTIFQVKADGNNPPTTVITNTGADLASSLAGKQYVMLEPALAGPKVGDQFVDEPSGLMFEVTSVKETKTVKVIPNAYTNTSYTIPVSVQYMGETFSVTEIGWHAFFDCLSLQSVTFLGNACQNAIGDDAFGNVGTETPVTLILPTNWTGSKPVNSETAWYGGYFNSLPISFIVPVIDQVNKQAVMLSHYPNGVSEYVDYIDYRWYRNGELVAEGVDNFREPSALNGCYHIEVPVDATKSQWVPSNELCFQNGVFVGIDEIDESNFSFSVVPNPVPKGSTMTVSAQIPEQQLQGASLMVYDLSGHIFTTMPMSQQSVTLTAEQTPGVYVIQITTRTGEKYIQKVVVR